MNTLLQNKGIKLYKIKKLKRIRKSKHSTIKNFINSSKQMHHQYQNDSIIDDSVSSNHNRSRQSHQEQHQSRFVSNRQKILNLHERIKMLDQIGNGGKEQRGNVEFLSRNSKKEVKFEDDEHERLEEKLRKVGSEKVFFNRSSSPKQHETEANTEKPHQSNKLSRQNIQSPIHHTAPPLPSQQPSPLQQSNPSFLHHSTSTHQRDNSAPRLPYSQSPKHYESQNILNSYYRPNPTNEVYPLQGRYLSIEDKFLQFKMSQETLLGNIQSEIRELQESCKQVKKEYEKGERRNEETVDAVEKYINAEINQLAAELKEVKRGAIQSLDTKHKAIRSQTIATVAEEFETQCRQASQQIQTSLQSAQRLLQKEQTLRDETADFLIHSFGDEIIKLQEVLNTQRQARIRKNDQLLKMINTVEDLLMDRIQKQKREMVENIENMENMLEQVCYKIEEKILGN